MAKITSIVRKSFVGTVNDLSVHGSSSYNIQGLAVHNSGVASLCLYCLGVTALDPIKYKLMFSRFLNPDRISPPDVDVDFDQEKQQKVIDYAARRYGADCVARISTYGSLKAKDAIKRAAKALDIGGDFETTSDLRGQWESGHKTLSLVKEISACISEEPHATIESSLKASEALRSFEKRYPALFKVAKSIEGTLSNASVHAAGIVICKEPVVNYVPMRTADGVTATQFTKDEVEALGLLKFDILALKTLTMIEKCLDLVRHNHGVDIKLNQLDPDGPESKPVFEMLNLQQNDGVFQFESGTARAMLSQIHVDSFEDMIVVNALNRPGTLMADLTINGEQIHGVHNLYIDYKHKRREIQYVHPKLKEILKDTYGIMVFQENLTEVAMQLAGYSASKADKLRKACGKKIQAIMDAERKGFVEGCVKNDVDEASANKVFDLIALFAGYGFNRSHSAAYSFLAYQTAYLKYYYPKEFYAALLTTEKVDEKRDRYERSADHFAKAPILPPDVSFSTMEYRIESGGIRRPLTAVKGVGEKAALEIIKRQPFLDLGHFTDRLSGVMAVNVTVVRALGDAGAMNRFGLHHEAIVGEFERLKLRGKTSSKRRQQYGEAEGSLFDEA
jgi:DNA polymerase-3 subunit alpha